MFLFSDHLLLSLLKDGALDGWVDSREMKGRREQMMNVNGQEKKEQNGE